jgi:hypothetical protein
MKDASLALPLSLPMRSRRCTERRPWLRVAVYGLLLAAAWTAMEFFALPLADMDRASLLGMAVAIAADNLLFCAGLAAAALLLERHSAVLPLLAPVPLIVAAHLVGPWNSALRDDPDSFTSTVPHRIWANLVYGGIFVFAYRLSMRSERTQRLLAQAEAAREQAESLLDAEQLHALRGQVDPALLLRVMDKVQRRYAGDARGADRLLDALVAFLRAAMPGVRHGASTLAAELFVAQQHAALRAELEPGRTILDVQIAGELPELPFPALLLLPLLDALAGDAPQSAARLNVRCDASRCTLSLSPCGAPAAPTSDWLTPELLYRLQVGLRAAYGDGASLVLGDALTLALPLGSVSTQPAEEALPWTDPQPRFVVPSSTTTSGA